MTVQQAISTFRIKLGAFANFDDDGLSDEAIYKLLSDAMSIVIERYKSKWHRISPWMWSSYGIKLVMVNSDFFECESIEHCTVLQSEQYIPEPLMARHKPLFKVYNGTEELVEYSTGNAYDDYLKTKPSWEIVNNKLRIYNNKILKAVTIKTIPYDFMRWASIQYCLPESNGDCMDLNTMEWPLMSDAKMQSMCQDLCLQSLGLTLNQLQQEPNANAPH